MVLRYSDLDFGTAQMNWIRLKQGDNAKSWGIYGVTKKFKVVVKERDFFVGLRNNPGPYEK